MRVKKWYKCCIEKPTWAVLLLVINYKNSTCFIKEILSFFAIIVQKFQIFYDSIGAGMFWFVQSSQMVVEYMDCESRYPKHDEARTETESFDLSLNVSLRKHFGIFWWPIWYLFNYFLYIAPFLFILLFIYFHICSFVSFFIIYYIQQHRKRWS